MRIALLLLIAPLVVAQSVPVPKPKPELDLLDLKSPGAWPVLTLTEDWAAARTRIAGDAAWQSWLTAERTMLDDWMAKQRDRTEWIAGWWHDFVSPNDGSFLTWTPEEPRDYLSSPSDPRVPVTPKLHDAWVFGFRHRHIQKIVDAARFYRLTGESRYAEWAAVQLDFYAGNFEKWPLKKNAAGEPCCRLSWQSLDEAVNLSRFVTAARLLGDFPSQERRSKWINDLFRPEVQIINSTFQRIHNIACWQRSAAAQVALYANDDEMWKQAVDGPFGIRQQVMKGVTADYLWLEQSFGYNQYVVSALEPFFYYAVLTGRAEPLRNEIAKIGNMLLSTIMMRFPSGQLPNPADSTGGPRSAPSPATLAAFYRMYPTPIGLKEAVKLRNWDTLLDPPRTPEEDELVPPARAASFETSRMAIIKDGPWQVYFHYGQIDPSHAQAEALNFEAAYGVVDVTHDPGTVGYGSPLHRAFYTRGIAHNVPLIDGEGQQRWNPGRLLQFTPSSVRARQDEYRPGIAAERSLRLDHGRLIDVVSIESKDTTPRKLGVALHLQGEVELPVAFRADPSVGFHSWENPHSAPFEKEAKLKVAIGGRAFQLTLRASSPFRVWWARTPDVPPAKRDSLYIETAGTNAKFETVLELMGQ